jgi:hypothetical protein
MAYFEDNRMDRPWTEGERGFTHYDMEWGTVIRGQKDPEAREGWDAWFEVRYDNGKTCLLNAERFLTPELARIHGYGTDPVQQARQELDEELNDRAVDESGCHPSYVETLHAIIDRNELSPDHGPENTEYYRGQLELVADIWPIPGVYTEERIDRIEQDIELVVASHG